MDLNWQKKGFHLFIFFGLYQPWIWKIPYTWLRDFQPASPSTAVPGLLSTKWFFKLGSDDVGCQQVTGATCEIKGNIKCEIGVVCFLSTVETISFMHCLKQGLHSEGQQEGPNFKSQYGTFLRWVCMSSFRTHGFSPQC